MTVDTGDRRHLVAIALEQAHLRGTPYIPNPQGGPPTTDWGAFADAALDAVLPTDEQVEAAVAAIPFEPYESPDRAEIVRAVLHLLDPPDEGEHILDVHVEKGATWHVRGACASCRRIWEARDTVLGLADQAVRFAHRDYLEQPTGEEPVMLVGRRTHRAVVVTDRRMPRIAH